MSENSNGNVVVQLPSHVEISLTHELQPRQTSTISKVCQKFLPFLGDAIQPSSPDPFFSFCPQYFLASGTIPMNQSPTQVTKYWRFNFQHHSFQ